MISIVNATGSNLLFTQADGRPRWYSVRLRAIATSGAGSAELQVNGASVETEIGTPGCNVSAGTPESVSTHLLLEDGDVVSVDVDGDPLDLTFGANADPEEI